MPEVPTKPFPRRALIVGVTTMAVGLAVLLFMPRQWLAWSLLLLLLAVKHLALVAVAAGPLYAAFGERLFRRRHPARTERYFPQRASVERPPQR